MPTISCIQAEESTDCCQSLFWKAIYLWTNLHHQERGKKNLYKPIQDSNLPWGMYYSEKYIDSGKDFSSLTWIYYVRLCGLTQTVHAL